MYYTHYINQFEYRLKKAPFYVKSLYTLIPIVFLLLAFMYLQEIQNTNNDFLLKQLEQKIKNIHNHKKQSINQYEIIQLIEQYTNQNSMLIENLTHQKKVIELTLHFSLDKLVSFVHFCEWFHPFSKIETLNVEVKEHMATVYMKLSFAHYFQKENKINLSKAKKSDKRTYILNAIIGKYVLINNQIYTNNDHVDSYMIKNITHNSVVLENNQHKQTLKVHHVE